MSCMSWCILGQALGYMLKKGGRDRQPAVQGNHMQVNPESEQNHCDPHKSSWGRTGACLPSRNAERKEQAGAESTDHWHAA